MGISISYPLHMGIFIPYLFITGIDMGTGDGYPPATWGGLGDDEVMTGDLVSDPYRRSTKSCRGNGLPTTLDLHDRLIRWGWVMMHALVHIRLVSTKIIQTICNQRQGHIVKIFHPALLCTWQHHLHLRTDHKVSLFPPSLLTVVLLHSPLIDIFQKLKCL